MKPSVCLVVGDNHTPHCGVKDYAQQLCGALGSIGLDVEVLAPSDWGVKAWLLFCKKLRERQLDIVHIQYPSIGNRRSLGPHVLGAMKVAKNILVTLHEYSAMPLLQRAATHLFRFTADTMLFTDEAEMSRYGWSRNLQRVIHIGSNVPAFSSDLPRAKDVLYFGQIRPGKGLEQFLELAHLSRQLARPFKYKVIGSVPLRRGDYYKTVRAKSGEKIEWLLDLPFEEVARRMATSLAAYLPFPDGASYRRGSLLASLTNGLPTITTLGPGTHRDMRDVLLSAADPRDALEILERLSRNPGEVLSLSRAEKLFSSKFSWEHIARQHEEIYMETVSRTASERHRNRTTVKQTQAVLISQRDEQFQNNRAPYI